MAHIIADKVKETTQTSGTGTITLAGASNGYRSFNSQMATNDTCFYSIKDGAEWEIGLGTFTDPDQLARTTILSSSNSGSIITLSSSNTKDIFITQPASQMPFYESSTFTPVLYGSTSAGTGTYTSQYGTYVKIGRQVTFKINIGWSAHTGTGNMRISGLPYSNGTSLAIINVYPELLSYTNDLAGAIQANQNYVEINSFSSAANSQNVAMDSAASLSIAGTYLTA